MSRFAVVPTHWLRHAELSTTDKAVLAVLATYASEERYSFPSVARISADLKLAVRTVQYALRTLEEIGAVRVERRQDDEGRDSSNGYWLVGYDLMQRGVQSSAPSGVQPIAPGRVQPSAPKQYQLEQDQFEQATTPTAKGELVFSSEEQQHAYRTFRRMAPNRQSFDATLRALCEGLTTGKTHTMDELGMALLELSANGEGFNVSRLRGYLRMQREAGAGASTGRPSSGSWFMPTEEEKQRMVRELEAELAAKGKL